MRETGHEVGNHSYARETAAHHLGDDRVDRVRRPKDEAAPFGNALVELARTDPRSLDSQPTSASTQDLHIFAKQFPDRYYQMGMAESTALRCSFGHGG
jgi:deoxyxylulose-5-phosphate synthase